MGPGMRGGTIVIRVFVHSCPERRSHVEWFVGNFEDYEADKMRRLGTDSTIPTRIKYKKFSR